MVGVEAIEYTEVIVCLYYVTLARSLLCHSRVVPFRHSRVVLAGIYVHVFVS